METIILSGKKELDIYINPQRQTLLRCMKITGVPMTPKQLADQMGISASSVQHHIKKLVELGIVGLSHTRRIRGITASYYHVLPKTVSIGGMVQDENTEQRLALLHQSISSIFDGYSAYCKKGLEGTTEELQHGDMITGILRLKPEKAKELYRMIRAFLTAHEQAGEEGTPWEYALIAYPVEVEEAGAVERDE